MSKPSWEQEDRQIEEIMGRLLRAGVALAAAVVFIGGIMYLVRYGQTPPHYGIFRGEPQDLRSIPTILHFAFAGHRRGYIQVGLLLLIATPITRVAFSVFAFLRERDYLYVGATLLVLAVLLFSLIGARR